MDSSAAAAPSRRFGIVQSYQALVRPQEGLNVQSTNFQKLNEFRGFLYMMVVIISIVHVACPIFRLGGANSVQETTYWWLLSRSFAANGVESARVTTWTSDIKCDELKVTLQMSAAFALSGIVMAFVTMLLSFADSPRRFLLNTPYFQNNIVKVRSYGVFAAFLTFLFMTIPFSLMVNYSITTPPCGGTRTPKEDGLEIATAFALYITVWCAMIAFEFLRFFLVLFGFVLRTNEDDATFAPQQEISPLQPIPANGGLPITESVRAAMTPAGRINTDSLLYGKLNLARGIVYAVVVIVIIAAMNTPHIKYSLDSGNNFVTKMEFSLWSGTQTTLNDGEIVNQVSTVTSNLDCVRLRTLIRCGAGFTVIALITSLTVAYLSFLASNKKHLLQGFRFFRNGDEHGPAASAIRESFAFISLASLVIAFSCMYQTSKLDKECGTKIPIMADPAKTSIVAGLGLLMAAAALLFVQGIARFCAVLCGCIPVSATCPPTSHVESGNDTTTTTAVNKNIHSDDNDNDVRQSLLAPEGNENDYGTDAEVVAAA